MMNIKKHTPVKKIKRKALPYLRKNIILKPLSYDKLSVRGKTEKNNFDKFTKTRFIKAMKMEKPNLENISAATTTRPTFLEFINDTPALSAVGKCDTSLRRTSIINNNERNFQFFV
jgi:hypothetical protein